MKIISSAILVLMLTLVMNGCNKADASPTEATHQNNTCECSKLSAAVKSPVYGACSDEKHPLMQGNYYEVAKDGSKVYYTKCRGLETGTCPSPDQH